MSREHFKDLGVILKEKGLVEVIKYDVRETYDRNFSDELTNAKLICAIGTAGLFGIGYGLYSLIEHLVS